MTAGLVFAMLCISTWQLDNATNQLLDGRASNDYRPILSYSDGQKWLHGY